MCLRGCESVFMNTSLLCLYSHQHNYLLQFTYIWNVITFLFSTHFTELRASQARKKTAMVKTYFCLTGRNLKQSPAIAKGPICLRSVGTDRKKMKRRRQVKKTFIHSENKHDRNRKTAQSVQHEGRETNNGPTQKPKTWLQKLCGCRRVILFYTENRVWNST